MSDAAPAERVGATSDPDAGNAPEFREALRRRLGERTADGRNLAVLLIDCGVVGAIDAVWGFQVGDAVRARVASTLRASVLRPDDLVGEMGRDHLACVLSMIEGPAVAPLAAEKMLRALKAPFWIGEDEIFARPAIGIAVYPGHGGEAELLLQRARIACGIARELAGRVAEFSGDRDNAEASRLLYENRLRTAVADDALELVFQPQYDLRGGQMMGVQCMLRWRDAALGVIPALDAFSAAQEAGVVSEMASSILNRALRNCSEFRYSAGLDLRIAVGFPARALLYAEFPDIVDRALGTWRLRPGRLNLEIGGTSLLMAEPAARETLGRLKELGVKLCIDDTGMALCSLFRLADLPFREIKLDASAANGPAGAPHFDRIMQSLIELAHQLKLDVVAVGVRDDAAETRLKELGCDYMQADFKGPALDPQGFVARFGTGET